MVLVNALSTGSCGNCYIIKYQSNEKTDNLVVNSDNELIKHSNINSVDNSDLNSYIMLDCGFSYKQLKDMLSKESIEFKQISYLIITHEHSDHIKGLNQILKLYPTITLIISKGTYSSLKLNHNKTIFISGSQKITIESTLNIIGVDKTHDGEEPLSFIIENNSTKKKIAFFTDLGEYNPIHINMLQSCDIIFLETNYDEELIKSSNMHQSYLQRLKSPLGHLSNTQARELCLKFIRENQTIVLSHISENVNSYQRAFNSIQEIIISKKLCNTILKISYQQKPTNWI